LDLLVEDIPRELFPEEVRPEALAKSGVLAETPLSIWSWDITIAEAVCAGDDVSGVPVETTAPPLKTVIGSIALPFR
jgi:hypothetical protein